MNTVITRRGAFVILAAGIGVFLLASTWLYSSFRLGDDTYIYLQFVKNALSGGGISFNYGEATYGFTSVIWLLLLMAVHFVTGDFLLTPIILDLAASILCIIICWIAARRFVPGDWLFASSVAVVFAVEPNLLKHAFLGMETPLSGLLAFAVVFLHMLERKNESGVPWSGLLAGISLLNRPESALIICLILIDQKIHGYRWRRTGIWLLFTAIPLVLWMRVAVAVFGTVIPNTLLAKGGAYPVMARFWDNCLDSAVILLPPYAVAIWILLSQLVAVRRRKDPGVWQVWIKEHWLWYSIPLAVVLALCCTISHELVYARYYFLFAPTIVFAAILFLHPQYSFLSNRVRTWLRFLLVAEFIAVSLWMAPATSAIFRPLEEAKGKLHNWIIQNTPADASVFTGTIGRIAFETDRKILCSMGIVNPEIIPYLKEHRESEYYKRVQPDYAVIVGKSAADTGGIQFGARDSLVYSVPVGQRFLVRQMLFGPPATDTLHINVIKLNW